MSECQSHSSPPLSLSYIAVRWRDAVGEEASRRSDDSTASPDITSGFAFYSLLVTYYLPHCLFPFLISSVSHPLSRLSSTASGSDSLFGPPLESAFKSKSFAGRDQLQRAESVFGASECKYGLKSSDDRDRSFSSQ